VLIDGVRVNPASAGGAALQNITPDMIERIEIVEGPRSTLYGSDAIAGVVNIITRAPQATRYNATVGGGSDGRLEASAGLAGREGPVGLALDASHQQSDGIPSCANSSLDQNWHNDSVNLRTDAKLGGVELEGRVWNAQGRSKYLDSCDPTYGLNPLSQNFLNQILALSAGTHPLANWDSTLAFSRGEDRIRQDQADPYDYPLQRQDSIRTLRPELAWNNDVRLGANRLGIDFDGRQERVDSLSYGTQITENTETLGGAAHDAFDLGRNHALAAISETHYSDFGDRFNWNAEYGFDVLTATRISIASGTGFRAPDADDRYGFGGNPALKPERARNYELGLKQRIGSTQTAELHVFRNIVSDLILVEFDPSNDPNVDFGYKAVNIAHARTEGAQAVWRYTDAHWSIRASAIVQDPQDQSGGTQLLRRARDIGTLDLTRHFGRAWADAGLYATSGRPDVDAISGAPTRDGGYALLNLGAGFDFARHWTIAARLDNLLDRDYQTAAGYNQPGRTVYCSLRFSGG